MERKNDKRISNCFILEQKNIVHIMGGKIL